jgi:hypothetical protein
MQHGACSLPIPTDHTLSGRILHAVPTDALVPAIGNIPLLINMLLMTIRSEADALPGLGRRMAAGPVGGV